MTDSDIAKAKADADHTGFAEDLFAEGFAIGITWFAFISLVGFYTSALGATNQTDRRITNFDWFGVIVFFIAGISFVFLDDSFITCTSIAAVQRRILIAFTDTLPCTFKTTFTAFSGFA
jgi:hypothetical protein